MCRRRDIAVNPHRGTHIGMGQRRLEGERRQPFFQRHLRQPMHFTGLDTGQIITLTGHGDPSSGLQAQIGPVERDLVSFHHIRNGNRRQVQPLARDECGRVAQGKLAKPLRTIDPQTCHLGGQCKVGPGEFSRIKYLICLR